MGGGRIFRSVMAYWLLLLLVTLAARRFGLIHGSKDLTILIAAVTAVYMAVGFIRVNFFRK